jgi:hypothetical protein
MVVVPKESSINGGQTSGEGKEFVMGQFIT